MGYKARRSLALTGLVLLLTEDFGAEGFFTSPERDEAACTAAGWRFINVARGVIDLAGWPPRGFAPLRFDSTRI